MATVLQDHYAVLGISQSASVVDIKKVFRKLALSHHPDKNPDNTAAAQEAFVKVRAAYEVLINPTTRNAYDTGQARRTQPCAGTQNHQHQKGNDQRQGPPPKAPKAHRQNQSNQYRSQNEGRAQQAGWGHNRTYDKRRPRTSEEQAAWEASERADGQRRRNAWAEWQSTGKGRRAEEVKREHDESRQRHAEARKQWDAERQHQAWEKWETDQRRREEEQARQREEEQARQREEEQARQREEEQARQRKEEQARQREAGTKRPQQEGPRYKWTCGGLGSSMWRDDGEESEEAPHRATDGWQKWEEELVKQQEQAQQVEAERRQQHEAAMRDNALRREIAEAVARAHEEKLRKMQEEEMRQRVAESEAMQKRVQEEETRKRVAESEAIRKEALEQMSKLAAEMAAAEAHRERQKRVDHVYTWMNWREPSSVFEEMDSEDEEEDEDEDGQIFKPFRPRPAESRNAARPGVDVMRMKDEWSGASSASQAFPESLPESLHLLHSAIYALHQPYLIRDACVGGEREWMSVPPAQFIVQGEDPSQRVTDRVDLDGKLGRTGQNKNGPSPPPTQPTDKPSHQPDIQGRATTRHDSMHRRIPTATAPYGQLTMVVRRRRSPHPAESDGIALTGGKIQIQIPDSRPSEMDDPPQPKRTSHSKVKTGCLTCRKRKVKCDEGKPYCRRCINLHVPCQGYLPIASKHASSQIRPILPAADSEKHMIRGNLARTIFNDNQEYSYFQTFISDVAPRTIVAGEYNVAGFLTNLVPQACSKEPALRHGLVALGALSMTQPYCQKSSQEVSKKITRKQHYIYALRRYQKALKSMQKLTDLRTILIAVILAFCFEIGTDRLDLGLQVVLEGFKLLREWMEKNNRPLTSAISSPRPDVIEDELVEMFKSLSVHIWTVADVKQYNFPLELNMPNPGFGFDLRSIPKEFKSADDARSCIEYISSQSLFFFQALPRPGPTRAASPRPRSYCAVSKTKGDKSLVLSAEQDAVFQELKAACKQWYKAAANLWKKSIESRGPFYYRMAALRIIAHCVTMRQIGMEIIEEIEYDKYLPIFQEIYTLQSQVLDAQPEKGQALDEGVVLSLFLLGIKCRHRELRRKAIALMYKVNRREGMWDSNISARVSEFTMMLEEAGTVEGDIPEEDRVCIRGIAVNSRRKEIFIDWVMHDSITGERVCKDTTITLEFH
ncbi:hypothetical protein B7494_g344 [Chlorociboria aeruginascens]|nr:hypothetical protein B7494_g344 [Chlorociboria aeruginascens]